MPSSHLRSLGDRTSVLHLDRNMFKSMLKNGENKSYCQFSMNGTLAKLMYALLLLWFGAFFF